MCITCYDAIPGTQSARIFTVVEVYSLSPFKLPETHNLLAPMGVFPLAETGRGAGKMYVSSWSAAGAG